MVLDRKTKDGKYIAFEHTAKDRSLWHSILGNFCTISYLVIWISSIGCVFFIPLLFMWGWYLTLIALIMIISLSFSPAKYVHRIEWLAKFYVLYTRMTYSNASLIYEEKPDRERQGPVLYCVHPHGIFPQGWGLLFPRPELRHVKFMFSTALWFSPLFRLLTRLTGQPSPADKKTMLKHMRTGQSLALIPGGFEEATVHSSNEDRIYLKKRKGFIKYSLQHGYSLVPVYVFGERHTYSNLQGLWKLRLWLNTFSIPAIFPWGKWWCPLLPRDTPRGVHIVCGKALDIGQCDQPTAKQIDEAHAKYMRAVTELYENNKDEKRGDKKLHIW